MDNEELKTFMDKKARLGLNQGYIFGQGGEGFVRMNLGCPRAVVREALQRLEQAVNAL
jgi:cysteine-S-conjugate beta-lyase